MRNMTFYSKALEGMAPNEVRQFAEIITNCERIAFLARKKGAPCAVPRVRMVAGEYGLPNTERFSLVGSIHIEGWDYESNTLHPIMYFPITNTERYELIFPDDGTDHCIPEKVAKMEWGFLGLPGEKQHMFKFASYNELYARLMDGCEKVLWIINKEDFPA